MPQIIVGGGAITGISSLQYTGSSVFLSEPATGGLITEYSVTGIPQRTIGTLRNTGYEAERDLHLAMNAGVPVVDPTGGFYFVFLAGAYRWGDLSFAYPVMRGGGPLIVALAGGSVFGEVLSATHWAAIALISMGILALASGAHDRRATYFAVGNAMVIAAYTLIDAKGVRASGAPISYTLWFFAANGFVIGALGWLQRGRDLGTYARRRWPRAMLGGALALGAYGIALWAMTLAPVALVAVLRETSVIFAAIIGALFLREKFTRRRLIATGAVLCGLAALRL